MSLTDLTTGASVAPTLPPKLRTGAVHLTVADLDRSVAWYQQALAIEVAS
jgi:catechol-2,3-dioxygenase